MASTWGLGTFTAQRTEGRGIRRANVRVVDSVLLSGMPKPTETLRLMPLTARRGSHLSNVLKDNFIPRDHYLLCPVDVIDALTSGETNAVYGIHQADEVKAFSFQ